MTTEKQISENPLVPLVRVIVQQVLRELRENSRESESAQRRLLCPEKAAHYLSLSRREVYNMIANGQLRAVRQGRRKMLDIRDLEMWIEENKR
jgi:excisionase family DNA binding protein